MTDQPGLSDESIDPLVPTAEEPPLDIHKPKPVHNWREFLSEIGVIVIGVLIALTGEQIVEAARTAHEVSEARRAIQAEARFNLGIFRGRLERAGCIDRRLDQLERWWADQQAGRHVALKRPIGHFTSWTMEATVWGTAQNGAAADMPFEERTGFATLFDRFRNYESIRDDELEQWGDLADFDGETALDPASLMRLRGLITRLRLLNARMQTNKGYVFPIAERLGAVQPRSIVPKTGADRAFCEEAVYP